ncbi:FAD-dependent oxidoreductase [Paenibacillus sp. J5C_2022]|uniref:FAD-dependent oxidoreductase n=1 Tax=Paenibacillus sp. J5C2022 TaxID=2977129 RepID=UPI0021D15B0B|nr:FAD-dependent oxidoreductase [Paenibacillus sp. J5C2022]MCU6711770.1 FAD-dependent oxidoreductase [Paenibacillus sp. J5C2022]
MMYSKVAVGCVLAGLLAMLFVPAPAANAQSYQEHYDVIVAGTDPEGIAAAVSAARNGLRVLLADGKGREEIGGLITLGWLNSLDLNYSPVKKQGRSGHRFLNRGIFQEWYDRLEGTSIDVVSAGGAFRQLVDHEENITVKLKLQDWKPIVRNGKLEGLEITDAAGKVERVHASVVVDATQDADIAAMAGVPYTVGREDLGDPSSRMAVTLVFKMRGITDESWKAIGRRKDTGRDDRSAWGFPEASRYVSSRPERVALRGLNIGRQNDGTVLINAMHLFDVDPLDASSRAEGMRIGREEAPKIAAYLKRSFKELEQLDYAGTAPELYVRESRHIQGEYRLTMADVMENRDHWDAIAYGSYEVDIQRLNRHDNGAVMMAPLQYGVPYRALVPLKVDNLLVVGRSASFDSLPHGSARVIPLGMATGQAAGAAAKLALERGITVRELSRSKEAVRMLQERLSSQGMDLVMHDLVEPAYMKHPAYRGLLAAVSMNLTTGGYSNDRWNLDGTAGTHRFQEMVGKLAVIHPQYFRRMSDDLDGAGTREASVIEGESLKLQEAAYIMCAAAGVKADRGHALDVLLDRGWVNRERVESLGNQAALTNGEAFLLIRDLLEHYAGVVYE